MREQAGILRWLHLLDGETASRRLGIAGMTWRAVEHLRSRGFKVAATQTAQGEISVVGNGIGRTRPERAGVRMRILDNGALEIVDPDPGSVALLQAVDPTFTIREAPLPGFTRPRLLESRKTGSGIPAAVLRTLPAETLRQACEASRPAGARSGAGEVSLLDVKLELAGRMLRRCVLCAHRCRIDRTRGERGRCGLGADASVYERYIHIAEEPPITPALNLSLRGCGMRCRHCQQAAVLQPRGRPGEALTPDSWAGVDLRGARSLTFIGGNPTESLPAVLAFLRAAPADFALPVGWNCSGYDSVDAIRLLEGVCDVYIPDFKYGNDACAVRLSRAPGYVANARAVLEEMCRQAVPVFVRILVLPGHVDCCHVPTLDALRALRSQVRLTILGQYAPDFLIREGDGALAGRPDPAEVARVRRAARHRHFEMF
jgi:putative pyruvate formate lyase activating enzyme